MWSLFVRAPDTLVVADYRPWRFSFFLADGTFIRSVEIKPLVIERPDVAFPMPPGEGFVLGEPCCYPDREFIDRTVTLRAFDEHGALKETVGVFWFERWGPLDHRGYIGEPVFGSTAAITHLQGDTIVYAPGRHSEFEVWTTAGDLRRIIRWHYRDRRVRPEDVGAWRRELRDAYETRFGKTPEVEQAIARESGDQRPVADSFPAHAGIVVADEGRIWAKEFPRPRDTGPDRWLIFGSGGRFVCYASMPKGMEVWDVGADFVLGVERDSLNVEYIVERRLRAPMER